MEEKEARRLVESYTDMIMRIGIFGKIVWMPYAELLTPIIIMVVCIPATVKRWIKMKNG